MKQLKATPAVAAAPVPPVSRWRYWTTPPEEIEIPAALLEPLLPPASRLEPFSPGQMVRLPAAEVFAKNVPQLPIGRLADLLPEHVRRGTGDPIRFPAQKIAALYQLVEHSEEILPEPVEEPAPEPVVAVEAEAPVDAEPEPTALVEGALEYAAPTPPPPPVAIEPPPAEQDAAYAPKPAPKKSGLLSGLPMFRRRTEEEAAGPDPAVPPAPPRGDLPSRGTTLPPLKPVPQLRIPRVLPAAIPRPPVPPVEVPVPEAPAQVPEAIAPAEPVAAEPVAEAAEAFAEPVMPEPVEIPEPAPAEPAVEAPRFERPALEPAIPTPIRPAVRILETEPVGDRLGTPDLPDEEPLQALFLTEERLTVPRVIELCGGLPGINSCVLTQGSLVVAAHNAPSHVDLVSLSAHAADMLRTMRESTARMGVGTVPAVTLHTEKGVISFFHREDLTMLVFHKDRGFVPGVREKLASVLGELTKANLTLPAGETKSFDDR